MLFRWTWSSKRQIHLFQKLLNVSVCYRKSEWNVLIQKTCTDVAAMNKLHIMLGLINDLISCIGITSPHRLCFHLLNTLEIPNDRDSSPGESLGLMRGFNGQEISNHVHQGANTYNIPKYQDEIVSTHTSQFHEHHKEDKRCSWLITFYRFVNLYWLLKLL